MTTSTRQPRPRLCCSTTARLVSAHSAKALKEVKLNIWLHGTSSLWSWGWSTLCSGAECGHWVFVHSRPVLKPTDTTLQSSGAELGEAWSNAGDAPFSVLVGLAGAKHCWANTLPLKSGIVQHCLLACLASYPRKQGSNRALICPFLILYQPQPGFALRNPRIPAFGPNPVWKAKCESGRMICSLFLDLSLFLHGSSAVWRQKSNKREVVCWGLG